MQFVTLIAIAAMFAIVTASLAVNANAQTDTEMDLALQAINQAEEAGGDASNLSSRFAFALELLKQADKGDFRDCFSYQDCIEKATSEFTLIREESENLIQRLESPNDAIIVQVASGVIAAFAVAYVAAVVNQAYQKRKVKSFLNSNIRKI